MINKSAMILRRTKLPSILFVLAATWILVFWICAPDCFAHALVYHSLNTPPTGATGRSNAPGNFCTALNMLGNAIEIFSIAWGGATLVLGCRSIQLKERGGLIRAFTGTFVIISGVTIAVYFDHIIESTLPYRLF